ncbi:hypothetical protein BO94DRAFT_581937 [Aspergillus sclerotioniger CBS 115572]|uniref:Endonuclease/exonuclease/phosphatase domain-containing protein n=1 Tax=Aspergillus sclerotioniger CBS 115572 TaxID=1450535 RepID=A0A317X7G6_9EURO|nr:hypothetical protein BO94DRAFT_581937 [Aspergillus sclerotioniger CBS 115572]PWY94544.1 hypothetical protein BO94DRAFT_581937 [Aspergillus sclerotioniger CBS 115572]
MAMKVSEWPVLAASVRKSEPPHERALDLQYNASALLRHLENPPGRSWWQGHEALDAEIKALYRRRYAISRFNVVRIDRCPLSELIEEAQIIVKLGDTDGVARFCRMISRNIFAKAEKLAAAKFVAVRQLKSRHLSLNIHSAAETARQHPAQARRLWKNTDIRTLTWNIVFHSMQVRSIDLTRPEVIIKALLTTYNANLDLWLGPCITTWERAGRQITMDLVFDTSDLMSRMIVCETVPAVHTDSNHLLIGTIINLDTPLARPKPRRNWKAVDTKKMREFVN